MKLSDVPGAVGRDLGATDWVEVTPAQVDDYVAATGDSDGDVPPLLLLALTNLFMPQLFAVDDAAMGVNYGTGEVRFPAPAAVGTRVRARAELVACDDVRGGIQTTVRITVEAEGVDAPVCVVDALSRWLV
ncbi:MAG TPA: dehydratase [Acidimicrobiales bacterium]|nr:dehydratase [Acidimicrobiales bacterium]